MKIDIICIGKLKEDYWRNAAGEYIKRLSPYCDINIVELPESRLHGDGGAAEARVKEEEGESILAKLPETAYVIALDIKGKSLSSDGLAEKIGSLALGGRSEIAFIIGGSLGLSEAVLAGADYRLSFSEMTFPHQMMRVILLEQIYRSYKIMRGETYHK